MLLYILTQQLTEHIEIESLEWVTFTIMVIVGGCVRILYNYDKNKIKLSSYLFFKILVYSFAVSFIFKEGMILFDKERWNVVVIPLVSFTSEVIINTYGDNTKELITKLLAKWGFVPK